MEFNPRLSRTLLNLAAIHDGREMFRFDLRVFFYSFITLRHFQTETDGLLA